jgi:hypothetical protein
LCSVSSACMSCSGRFAWCLVRCSSQIQFDFEAMFSQHIGGFF